MGRRQGGAGRGRLRAARSEDFLNRWPWSTLMIVIMTRTETNAIPGAGLILGGGRRPGWGTARGIICQGGMSDNYGNNATYKWLWLRCTPASSVWTILIPSFVLQCASCFKLGSLGFWLLQPDDYSSGLVRIVTEEGRGNAAAYQAALHNCTHSAAQLHTDILCTHWQAADCCVGCREGGGRLQNLFTQDSFAAT